MEHVLEGDEKKNHRRLFTSNIIMYQNVISLPKITATIYVCHIRFYQVFFQSRLNKYETKSFEYRVSKFTTKV